MRLASVNVSPGETVSWQGRRVETGIFKKPVAGRVRVSRLQLAGDRQADLNVHGGELKAVYGYALEHYAFWRAELGRELEPGAFGENLTIEGFDEEDAGVGDAFRAGSALLEAVQPRLPCFKLGLRFGDPAFVKRFAKAGRFGVYFRVVEEGELAAGDPVSLERRNPVRVPVPALGRLRYAKKKDAALARRALSLPNLPPYWQKQLRAAVGRAPDF